jgi:outer-membrane receptor for ferric coprogen and ferric-rhodotorulic acid
MPGLAPIRHCVPHFPAMRVVLLVLAAAGPALPAQGADVFQDSAQVLPVVVVSAPQAPEPASESTGAYIVGKTRSATGLALSTRQTPQSLSVITRQKMDDFAQRNINDVLSATPAVTVEKVETDRTYYTSRGFDIVNFQYDGVGIPLTFGNIAGDLDTFSYDRVEILRGANGLTAATGNPSATVNFVRKRPTYVPQASASLTLGSWHTRRMEADVSGALTKSGSLAGRFGVVRQDGDSYLDRYSPDKTSFFGVLEANLSDHTVLSIGHTQQRNHGNGSMWGALPLYYTDGSPTAYPVSTSTAADWAYWNSRHQNTFVELARELDDDWHAKLTASRSKAVDDSRLFYVYGTPDRSTGLGLFSYPSQYGSENVQTVLDASATGKFTAAGRRHDLAFGVNWSRSTMNDISHYGRGIGTALPDLSGWAGRYPEPAFDAAVDGSAFVDRRHSAYAATRLDLADRLKLIGGVNVTRAESTGTAYGVSHRKSASQTTPYIGVVYDVAGNVSVYANYTRIFNPQSELDINGDPLSAIQGTSRELGVKSELFDRKLELSGAVFQTQQDNTAEQAGYAGPTAYYRGVNAQSQGIELALAGEVARGMQVSAGYTQMTLRGDDGRDVRTYVPRKLLRLSTTYRLAAQPRTQVGASVSWQSAVRRDQGGGIETRQAAYALLNMMARHEVDKHLNVAVNLNNVTNRKYLTSLYWNQAYYGAPRNASITLNWKY